MAAGGPADLLARLLAEQIARAQGPTMVIENRTGASTAIGTEAVARATPDGNTILMQSPNLVINAILRPSVTYNPLTSFEPICLLANLPLVLVVNSSSAFRSLADFLAVARARPGELTFASFGPGTPNHIAEESLKRAANVDWIYVPYPGGDAPAVAALLGGHITVLLATYSGVMEQVKSGALRPLADCLKVPALDIPPNIGGRFSVLTPVGTLPAALIGIDVKSLLAGAGEMAERCDNADLAGNPAGVFAMLQWLSDTQLRKSIAVFMPYSDPLRDFAAWFVQLWAESLGKKRTDGTSVGSTPLAALGATDQHAQVQLFMEGPADKTVTFVAVKERSTDVKIPAGFSDVKELGYLAGHSLGELIDIEQRATAGALARRGRPNMTIHLDRVDAAHVGQLMMLLEVATAYAGQLYDIDAFNQPGVELGKQFAYALLGRPGAEAAKKEWESLPKSDARWIV